MDPTATTDQAPKPKRSRLRRVLWWIGLGLGALILFNALFPDFDLSGQDKVALIRVEGVIIDAQTTVGELKQYSENPLVKAIVLRIDSPGGGVVPSQEIHDAVKRVKNKSNKVVIASMGSMAASGGYYIAMDADEIWASQTTLTGSIGVWAVLPTFQQTLQKIGVTSDGIGTTDLAGALNLERSLAPDAKAILQASVEHAYATFVGHVAAARNRSIDEIDAIAQGRVWAGDDAVTHGLIDRLGSFKDALDAAASRAGLGDDYKVEFIEPALGWRQALAQQSQVLAARITRALLPEQQMLVSARKLLSPVEQELARLARFEPMRAYYYCGCEAQRAALLLSPTSSPPSPTRPCS